MNKLFQAKDFFIASSEDLEILKTKDHARILVISDSHGNFQIVLKTIIQFGKSCDALVFCGDGFSDLAQILELAQENLELKKIIPPVIAFVKGNGDSSTYPVSFDIGKYNPLSKKDLKGTVFIPESQVLIVNNTKFFICHGHNQGVSFGLEGLALSCKLNDCSIALFGHNHVSEETTLKGYKFINPGSISRPRDGDKPGCAIITVEKKFCDTAFIKIKNSYSDSFEFSVQ